MKKDSNWPPVATTRLELDPGRLGFGPRRSSLGLAGKCQRSIWSAEVGDHRKTAEVLTWKIVSCQEIARRPNNGYICVLKDVSCTWKKLGFLMIALSVLHWYICCFQLCPIKKRGWCRFYLQAILTTVWNSWVCLYYIGTKQGQVPLSDATWFGQPNLPQSQHTRFQLSGLEGASSFRKFHREQHEAAGYVLC